MTTKLATIQKIAQTDDGVWPDVFCGPAKNLECDRMVVWYVHVSKRK